MVKYQKYMFDNFVITCDEEKCIGEELEVFSDEENANLNDEASLVTEEMKTDVVVSPIDVDVVINEDVENSMELEESEPETEEKSPSYSQDELDAAVETAELKGYEKGKNEAVNATEKAKEELLLQIDLSLKALVDEYTNLEQEAEASAMQIAIHAINKILPTLEQDVAKREVEAFLEDNFGNFRKETSLSFSFHPEMAAQIAPLLSKLADKNDFEGKIAVHKDINLGLSDCKVEWKSGGVERSSAQITEKIKELISK